jgi:hypothetical protein
MTQDQQRPASDEIAAAIAEFALDLKVIRRQAGDISYRRLASRMNYAVSTVDRALKGKKLPTWPVTESFLRACGCRPDEVVAWRTRWIKIADLINPLPNTDDCESRSIPPAQLPGQECDRCGVWVTDMDLHHQWHTMFVPRLAVVADGEQRFLAARRRTG